MFINSYSNQNTNIQGFNGLKSNRKFFTKDSIQKLLIKPGMTASQIKKVHRDNKILELLAEGFSKEKIAETLKISFSTVKRLFEKYKVAQTATKNRDEIIKTRLMNGEKRNDIAKSLGISIAPVNKVAERNSIYRIKKQERDDMIMEAYKKGMLYKDIANQFKVSKATIIRVVNKHREDYQAKL